MRRYVLGFAFFRKWVLLMEKKRPKWQNGLLNGVGGGIEDNEYMIEAMRREFKEETGIDVIEGYWKHVITLVSIERNSIVFIFRTKFDFDFTSMIEQTDEPVQLYEMDYISKPTISNLKWMIPLMLSDVEFPVIVVENKVIK